MKYTKEQLQFMFSSQLSEIIAELIHYHSFDINNWNDVMSLAVDRIKLMQKYESGSWYVEMPIEKPLHVSFTDKNPQRAIACCLILVLQEKNK